MKAELLTIAKFDGFTLNDTAEIVFEKYLTNMGALHRVAVNVIESLGIRLAYFPKANKVRFAIKRIEAACTKGPVNGEYVELVEAVAYGISLIDSKTPPKEAVNIDSMEKETSQTFGQKAVGLSFNPSQSNEVDLCKSNCAKLIDQMHKLRQTSESPEQRRLASVAITEMQTAQMWAVKALTWKD